MFRRPDEAKFHANKVHLRIKNYACSLAKEYGCHKRFFDLVFARNYVRYAHLHLNAVFVATLIIFSRRALFFSM